MIHQTTKFATKAQYTGGALDLKEYSDRLEALNALKFLTTRASTDWATLYEITITEEWVDITEEVNA